MLWSKSPASSSYGPTSYQSDHHVVLCWMVDYMMIKASVKYSNKRNLPHLNEVVILHHQWTWVITSVEGFVLNPLWYPASVCGTNMAATLQDFHMEYLLWHPDWLKQLVWLTVQNPLLWTCKGAEVFSVGLSLALWPLPPPPHTLWVVCRTAIVSTQGRRLVKAVALLSPPTPRPKHTVGLSPVGLSLWSRNIAGILVWDYPLPYDLPPYPPPKHTHTSVSYL